jgi:ornithine cyclodeaminase/alanine dehydrogenase-like protein (mu-crystallin family)
MSALYLTEADVHGLLNMPLALAAVEEAFRQWAAGHADNVPRRRGIMPGFVLHGMSAVAEYLNLAGTKTYATTAAGAQFHLSLYDTSSGELVALIEANRLGQLRTGATTGVAASWMAAPDAAEVGLFGAGYQAETQLEAVAAVRPVHRAFVYCRHDQRRIEFAERMTRQLQIEVVPADRPQVAAEELPIVITATSSREPVFDGTWLSEGTMVAAVGSNWLHRAEIDATVIRRADHIVCDSVAACQLEAGDFKDALEKGNFDWSRAVDLSQVVADRAVGRHRHESVSLFKSVGLALEDVALGGKLLELARAAGVGRPLPG